MASTFHCTEYQQQASRWKTSLNISDFIKIMAAENLRCHLLPNISYSTCLGQELHGNVGQIQCSSLAKKHFRLRDESGSHPSSKYSNQTPNCWFWKVVPMFVEVFYSFTNPPPSAGRGWAQIHQHLKKFLGSSSPFLCLHHGLTMPKLCQS